MTNHRLKAEAKIIDLSPANMLDKIALAQVHATLYLAEQQRIANLIAFHSPMLYPNGDTASMGQSMWVTDREQIEAVLFP